MRTLAGFRSRCTTAASCAASSPSAICRHTSSASSTGNGPRARLPLQVLARHELEREEPHVPDLVDAVDSADVRVIQRRERLGLAFEAPQPLVVVGQLLGEDLDGDLALEPGVLRAVDLPHPAGSEGAEDLVEREGLAGGERHGAEWSLAEQSSERSRCRCTALPPLRDGGFRRCRQRGGIRAEHVVVGVSLACVFHLDVFEGEPGLFRC